MTLRFVVVALLLGGLVGCVSLDEPASSKSSPPGLPPALPKASYPQAPLPVDRDQAKLLSALVQVDACALLDPGKAKVQGFTAAARHRRTAPHECRIEQGGAWVRVDLGAGDSGRHKYAPENVAGAKAYLDRTQHGHCLVLLPISFQYSISFYGVQPGVDDTCATVARFAGEAVVVLKRPQAAKVPLAGWTGCFALERLLGPAKGKPYQLGSYPTNNVDGCTYWYNGERTTDVSLSYGGELEAQRFNSQERLNGRPVGVTQGRQCWVTWNQGPSGEPDPRNKFVQVVVRAASCQESKDHAVRLMALLAGPEPRRTAAQTPLLYRVNDHDSKRPGACAHLIVTAETQRCEPYQAVDLPKGAVEVYRRAELDGHFACAMSVEAARQQLGDEFQPVVDEYQRCVYVRPSLGLEVRIGVGDRLSAVPRGARELRLLGREAYLWSLDVPSRRDVQLEVRDATGVVLKVAFTFTPMPGSREGIDKSLEERVEPLAQEIVLNSF